MFRRTLLVAAGLTGAVFLSVSCSQEPADTAQAPAAGSVESAAPHEIERYPLRRALFGDLHVHTSLSTDAYSFGNRVGPRDAYRFARGEAVELPNGIETRLATPLDFVALTDHAEGFDAIHACAEGGPLDGSDLCERVGGAVDGDERFRTAFERGRRHSALCSRRGAEHVDGERDVRRAGTSRSSSRNGRRGGMGDQRSAAGTLRRLHERTSDFGLWHFLERGVPVRCDWRVAAQQQDRAFRVPGGKQRGEGVAESRSGRYQRNTDVARCLRPGVGHVHRRALVAYVDDGEAGVDARIVDRHDLVAGEAEDSSYAGSRKRVHEQLGAVHRAHGCERGRVEAVTKGTVTARR